MSSQTDFNVAPYYDDFTAEKDFYKILFQPGVAVQARELNQMQTILQHQIEKFGDNIFKSGTIIDGCHMTFHEVFPYVKIKDNETSGAPVNVSQFENLFVKNAANLVAYVVKTTSGYESRSPNLNTLYVRYLNSGSDFITSTFAADETLTIYDKNNPISEINIIEGSSGFTNTDVVVITSALAVQNSTGGNTFSAGFYVGDIINNGGTANAVITAIDGTSNTRALILRIRPQYADLHTANSAKWRFAANDAIVSANTGQAATLNALVGTGATGSIVTDAVGQIEYIAVTDTGEGYYIAPHISIASTAANTVQIATANIQPQTYVTQVTVANSTTTPIGSGYGVTVDEGVIYQKGFFARVEKQVAIVEKYSAEPDAKSIGFVTDESIITSNIDTSLLDNATGTLNASAPGADRLKLTPTITALTSVEAEANTDFLPIASFSAGIPYKQNRQTQYSIIGDEMARRTFEESGNYVLDQFILTTKSPTDFADEATVFSTLVDPGAAYINGYRVETTGNYNIDVAKGVNTQISNTASVSLAYGNYVRVNEMGGQFQFAVGEQVALYSTAKTYITSSAGAAISAPTGLIGNARVRSIVYESGVPGTAQCRYKVYLFDIRMLPGYNFKNAKSIYYDGTFDGVCDIVLTRDASSGTNVAVIEDANRTAMTFFGGADAIKNANNITYTYRSIDTSRAANSLGFITKSLSGTGETFPYSVTLSDTNELDLIVVPQANLQMSSNIAGSLALTSGSANVVGTTTAFMTDLVQGDFVNVANSTANVTVQVASIANDTQFTMTGSAAASITGTANSRIRFPMNVPISLQRSTRSANVSADGSVLTINLGGALAAGGNVTVAYNVRAANVQPVTKTVNRDLWVRIRMANNLTTNTGPWCLGVADVFRLKGVYLGSNNDFAYNGLDVEDVTNEFYVDHNQSENSYGLSYLYKKSKSTYALASTSSLLVKFDAFTSTSDGLKAMGASYSINDTLELVNSTSTINTLEIPEMYDSKGYYYDMRDQLDFRPVTSNTATVTTAAGSATINPVEPSESTRFTSNDKKFPVPNSDLTCTLEYYQPRADRVVVDRRGDVRVLSGTSGSLQLPTVPSSSIVINNIIIPPYPTIPQVLSANLVAIADTKVASEKYTKARLSRYRVSTPVTAQQRVRLQPKGYRMQDIADLERRIADLEYYVSFTLAEALVRQRVIPSTNDPTVDRFKFGFFVDAFSDYGYADINNPGYNAIIADGVLQPAGESLVISFTPNMANTTTLSALNGTSVSFPFTEFTVAQQTSATDGPLVIVSNTSTTNSVANTTSNVVTQTIVCVVQNNRNQTVAEDGGSWEETEFSMSNTSGSVEMYVNSHDVNGFQIYYSNTSGFSTATLTARYDVDDFAVLSTADKANPDKVSTLGTVRTLDTSITGLGQTVATGTGKLLWTHDPIYGRYMKIRTTKYRVGSSADRGFVYKICYPTESSLSTTTTTVGVPETFTYSGTINSLTPNEFSIMALLIQIGPFGGILSDSGLGGYGFNPGGIGSGFPIIADSQAFEFVVSGLKPNTAHKLKMSSNEFTPSTATDESAKCQQAGKALGATMVTDASGKLSFTYFYDAGIDEATTDYTQANRLAGLAAGIKSFAVISADSSSKVLGNITIKAAFSVQQTQANTATPVVTLPPIEPSVIDVGQEPIGGTGRNDGGAPEWTGGRDSAGLE